MNPIPGRYAANRIRARLDAAIAQLEDDFRTDVIGLEPLIPRGPEDLATRFRPIRVVVPPISVQTRRGG